MTTEIPRHSSVYYPSPDLFSAAIDFEEDDLCDPTELTFSKGGSLFEQ